MKRYAIAAVTAGFFTAFTLGARATVIFDNINNANGGYFFISSSIWDAQRFSSDTTNLFLTSVTLALRDFGGSGTFFLRLYSDTGTMSNQPGSPAPGVMLTTLLTGSSPGSGNIFFGGLNQPLLPNTNYWLVLGDMPGPGLSLGWANTPDTTGSGSGFQTGNGRGSDAFGWVTFNQPYLLQINADPLPAVPEPATWATGVGVVLLLAFHYRKGKRQA